MVLSFLIIRMLTCNSVKEGYDSVRKWTSKIDIFSKKYIVVPINEQYVTNGYLELLFADA